MSLKVSDKQAEDDISSNSQSQDYCYKRDFRTALPQILAVSVKNCLLLGYGMTLGFPTILIPAVQKQTEGETLLLDSSEISWISSINLIVVPVGCALSGLVTAPLGRRRAMQMVNLPFFIAWLILHFASTKEHLYGALALTGLTGGLLEAPVLTYVAEITQPYLRGSLTASSSLCITLGVFTQFLFGLMFNWRTVALVNIFFTVLSFVLLFFVPESPHWLVSKGRFEEARLSLQWLRGWTESNNVEAELKDIKKLFNNKIETKGNNGEESFLTQISHYTNRGFLVPLFLVSYSFFVQHFSGMTTLQTYAVSIFQMLDAPIDRYYATLVLGLVQIFGTVTCVSLVHRVGKRPLALVSTMGGGLCCLLLAIYDIVVVKPEQDVTYEGGITNSTNVSMVNIFANVSSPTAQHASLAQNPYSWMPLVLLMLLAFITHTGIRLLPWILIGEVFNAKTRSGSAGISSAIGYIFGFLTNKMFISMVDTISIYGTYGMYSLICISGCIILHFILPETEGKKLIDIENHFAGIKKLSNQVYKFEKNNNNERNDGTKLEEIKGMSNLSFEADLTKL